MTSAKRLAHEPGKPRSLHQWPLEPARAPSRKPAPPALGGRSSAGVTRLEGTLPRRIEGDAGCLDGPVSDPDGLRARLPVAVLRSGNGRRQDTPDGGVHQLPACGLRLPALLCAGAESDHLRQADRRLLAELAQVRVQGHRRVCQHAARGGHRRHLRAARQPEPAGWHRGQHLQHLEDQFRSARRSVAKAVAEDQAAVGIPGAELLRLLGRTG